MTIIRMSQFYCREDELRKLNKRYAGDKFECIVIYSRRRVGKTALINEFCKDKPTIFFSALNTTGKENLEALSKSIMSFERPDMESAPEFRSYDAALDELTALSKVIIPGLSEPPVRTLRATCPENESHIFR